MGSRLAVYVRDGRGWSNYGSRGNAYNIGLAIAVNGYEKTKKEIAKYFEFQVAAEEPIVDVNWAEAILVIDSLHKNVFWYEEDVGFYLPRIINALIEQTWPGWTAIWCAEGRLSAFQACGIDPYEVELPVEVLDEIDWQNTPDLEPWYRTNNSDSVAVTYEDGVTLCWHQYLVLSLSEFSANSFYQFAQHVRKSIERGEPLEWNDQLDKGIPEAGIHIDYQNHQVRWWAIFDNDFITFECNERWPNWTFISTGDDYHWFEQLTGNQMRIWGVEMCYAFKHIAGIDEDESVDNSIPRIPSDQVLERELANSQGMHKVILQTLMQMKENGPIPPAKFIDRHGVIHSNFEQW